MEKYYIGGKQYIPEKSYLICSVLDGNVFSTSGCKYKRLYRTMKGAYFLVISEDGRSDVSVLDEADAYAFMDMNADGINTEIYDQIFGAPELG